MKFLLILILPFVSIQINAKKCADFANQKQAQAWYEQRKKSGQSGWKSLDRDGDGQACDCLNGGSGKKCPKKKK
ncbi:excalibur calcium-binding domain-containing protein [Acinetobacter ursingii]|uniref:excalibur calcium-binding domain-containing protein n=1 Tax=Acinetobacter ursingii TaxID=108980 RepID=UPI0021CD660C|nr:excalibur calcium-binding domain-containing protein [Acinetobacter ursingii]MCU4481362.1 excalibur calcium-binding domain-containing protein [Acinetobacter ursingii]MCU4505694.1 excalibur calcium-binding domain-containing protein [Acinetobacter ursingii]MCU4569640.1 excalibur calcium-binding domain-containing protein [Acinetobacter ursingii]